MVCVHRGPKFSTLKSDNGRRLPLCLLWLSSTHQPEPTPYTRCIHLTPSCYMREREREREIERERWIEEQWCVGTTFSLDWMDVIRGYQPHSYGLVKAYSTSQEVQKAVIIHPYAWSLYIFIYFYMFDINVLNYRIYIYIYTYIYL